MQVNDSVMTQENAASDLISSKSQPMFQTIQKPSRQSSVSSTTQKRNPFNINQRRQNLPATNSEFLTQRTSSSFRVPLLINTIDSFFQATQNMEDEIMLPTRLKDMPCDELVFDNSVQPDNWHEIYTFIRDIRNQLQCINPFANDDDHNTSNTNTNTSNKEQRRYSNDDEGIMISLHDNNQFSSTASTTSSDESEQSSTSSVAASYDTIKDELKYHYYGLFRALDSLASVADRVREKYREETKF